MLIAQILAGYSLGSLAIAIGSVIIAQILAGYSLGSFAIAIVVLLAVCGLVMVAIRAFAIPVPPWLGQVLAIVVIAFVIIVAIRIVMSM